MSELGKFLARFYGPETTFHSVHARIRHTRRSAPKGSSTGRSCVIGRRRSATGPEQESIENLEMWASPPDKARVESSQRKEGQDKISIEVINGDDAWKRHEDGTVERGVGKRRPASEEISLPTEYQRHFDRGLLRQCFAALTLEEIGTCQVAGRDCLKIRAKQVPGAQLWPHWFSFDAVEFELAADVEKAVLLSIVGIVEGQPVDLHEILEVTFDENIDDSLFTYEAGADETVQPTTPIAEHITLEAAAARAPFKVLRPAYLPESDRVNSDVEYHPARPTSEKESLTIFYQGAKIYDSLWIDQRGESDKSQQEDLEWDEIEAGGRRLQISDPYPEEGLKVLTCEHAGTHVSIFSDLPKDEMVKIALSLNTVSNSHDGD